MKNAQRMFSFANSAQFRMEAMALEIPDFPGHPNRVPFSGVLTRVDTASDRAPSGAAGHRVILPKGTAEKALPSLLGMAVDYSPGLRGHDTRRKIGVITRAEIVEDRLEIAGYLFGKDFPEVTREIRGRKHRLGMSYEVTNVRVEDPAADIWRLAHVVFTGAAILERAAAAYRTTSLAAGSGTGQDAFQFTRNQGEPMDENISKSLDLVAQTSQSLAGEFAGLRAAVEELRQAQEAILRLLEIKAPAQAGATEIETRMADLARTTEELRRQNENLRAQAERYTAQITRKTVPPQVQALLAKSGVTVDAVNASGQVDGVVLDKALAGLPVEQRMAIKSQLARAGALL
jgi:hypothetical protein